MKTRINCPLCVWFYDLPEIDPNRVSPHLHAVVFNRHENTESVIKEHQQKCEAVLDEHFKTHTLVEWVSKVSRQERMLADFQSKLAQSQVDNNALSTVILNLRDELEESDETWQVERVVANLEELKKHHVDESVINECIKTVRDMYV